MIIVIEAASADAAEVFISAEPYNRNGGFSHVSVRPWNQVIPEAVSGDLKRTLAAERAHRAMIEGRPVLHQAAYHWARRRIPRSILRSMMKCTMS